MNIPCSLIAWIWLVWMKNPLPLAIPWLLLRPVNPLPKYPTDDLIFWRVCYCSTLSVLPRVLQPTPTLAEICLCWRGVSLVWSNLPAFVFPAKIIGKSCRVIWLRGYHIASPVAHVWQCFCLPWPPVRSEVPLLLQGVLLDSCSQHQISLQWDSFNQHLDILQYMTTPAKQMVVDVSGMYDPLCAMHSDPILTAHPIHSPSPLTERLSHRLLFPNDSRVLKKDAGLGNSSSTLAVKCSITHVSSLIVTLA